MSIELETDQQPPEFDVRASFVTIVDHLPCEITRKLWFIQELNQQYDKQHIELCKRLNSMNRHRKLLSGVKAQDIPDSYKAEVDKIQQLRSRLRQLRIEGLTQSESLMETFRSAKRHVIAQKEQLEHELKLYDDELAAKEAQRLKELKEAQEKEKAAKQALRKKRRIMDELSITGDTTSGNQPEQISSSPVKRTRRKRNETPEPTQQSKEPDQPSQISIRLRIKRPTSDIEHDTTKSSKESTVKLATRKRESRTQTKTTGTGNSNSKKKSTKKPTKQQQKETTKQESEEEAERSSDDENLLYCVCNKPSRGKMVGCDNDDCTKGWFHYSCVGVKNLKEDSAWFCPECCKLKGIKYNPRGITEV
ncbi:hypothetical protein WICPIJ_007077 [Wickerhamomyces pijperi]|uniref:PHD-type domain-containing protein n=1 Tax=Wickerhamomyces pijperi TaxID=599730 RepID=A0A9P8Q0J5_WICPI|nr:hypothetical protein WICPIJ_007077 [Wickerhamomyces pijperi]